MYLTLIYNTGVFACMMLHCPSHASNSRAGRCQEFGCIQPVNTVAPQPHVLSEEAMRIGSSSKHIYYAVARARAYSQLVTQTNSITLDAA